MTIAQEQTICCHVFFSPFLEEHLVWLLQILYKARDNSFAISVVCALVRGKPMGVIFLYIHNICHVTLHQADEPPIRRFPFLLKFPCCQVPYPDSALTVNAVYRLPFHLQRGHRRVLVRFILIIERRKSTVSTMGGFGVL